MSPVTNARVLFNEIPQGYPDPNKTVVYDDSQTIDLDTVALDGGVLVKVLVLSIDPYMRGKMRHPDVKSYSPPFIVGEPISNFAVGLVIRSENPNFKVGDHVSTFAPFQEYVVYKDAAYLRVLENKENLPWSAYVGVAGMPGRTAYHAWKEYSSAKKGEIVFVTAGAGPVGSAVIQIAKAEGLKVIASAGSEEKVAFLKSIGADVAFNYKTANTSEILSEAGPIDIYWDNVGGETLEAALANANHGARFIECGMISAYNSTPYFIKNLINIVGRELKIFGFIVSTLASKYDEAFYKEFPQRIANGEIKYLEDAKQGLKETGQAIYEVQKGLNKGKSVIVVASE
ncbi:hypothetical protein QCA50_005041 [Cerrena zonata]|uniref:Enoyl reductase (ER) domain-containing protein n=1 Tax=Cerrena zonata TaxID=2478898 RepID=A0AAW0GG95_9APHY